MLKGTRHKPATIARLSAISSAKASERRERNRISARELADAERTGKATARTRPHAIDATHETAALFEAQGGYDAVSVQRRMLTQDLGRLGFVLRVLVEKFKQGDGDPDLATKIATLIGHRRSSLTVLGLDHVERDIDLRDYLRERGQDAPGASSSGDPSPSDRSLDTASHGVSSSE